MNIPTSPSIKPKVTHWRRLKKYIDENHDGNKSEYYKWLENKFSQTADNTKIDAFLNTIKLNSVI